MSNHTHYSTTDPEARISTKPGKPRNLNYLGQIEENGIDAYIPNFGRYKPEREGFAYNKELDRYECQQGNKAVLTLQNANVKNGEHTVRRYSSSKKICANCAFLEKCCGKSTKYKKLDDSIHKEYYDRMHQKLTDEREYAKRLFRSRSSTVEPVIGTLINHLAMKRVNARGIALATKHILMASLTYNLKKYLKFINKTYAANCISKFPEIRVIINDIGTLLPIIVFSLLNLMGFKNQSFRKPVFCYL